MTRPCFKTKTKTSVPSKPQKQRARDTQKGQTVEIKGGFGLCEGRKKRKETDDMTEIQTNEHPNKTNKENRTNKTNKTGEIRGINRFNQNNQNEQHTQNIQKEQKNKENTEKQDGKGIDKMMKKQQK